MSGTKYLDLRVFQEGGFLLEANRQFFHPLGLALGIYWDKDDLENEKGIDPATAVPQGLVIYDSRDDPEGTAFYSLADEGDWEKHEKVAQQWDEKAAVRAERFGWVVQPMGTVLDE